MCRALWKCPDNNSCATDLATLLDLVSLVKWKGSKFRVYSTSQYVQVEKMDAYKGNLDVWQAQLILSLRAGEI